MSKIDELIKRFCPNGVEYKKIKDVYTRIKGTPITAGKMHEIENNDGEIKIFAGGKTIINAYEKDIPKANITRVPAVIVQSRGVIDFIYYDKPFTFKNEMWAYTSNNEISIKFLYYILKNNVEHFRDAASGMGSMPQISLSVTEDFAVPVPPLEVQCEIVHILDDFTLLSAELSAELKARQKQYEYYLENYFIKLSKKCKNTKLNDCIISLTTGLNPRKNFKLNVAGAKLPYITGKDVYNNTINITDRTDKISQENVDLINKRARLQDDIILFASTGTGTVGRLAYIEKYTNNWNISETLFVLKAKQEIYTKYLLYVLESEFAKKQYRGKISKGSVPHLKISDLLNVNIPIPEYEEQVRISNILSKFDMYCHDIFSGLPAEIEARRKQYEYYRDKLLNFKDLKVEE